jgi:hypothetical protein
MPWGSFSGESTETDRFVGREDSQGIAADQEQDRGRVSCDWRGRVLSPFKAVGERRRDMTRRVLQAAWTAHRSERNSMGDA